MIDKTNFRDVLRCLGFAEIGNSFVKKFDENNFELKVDFDKQQLIYPENKGFIVNERQTCNFAASENFVVFECIHKLLHQGYDPKHIELEPKWQVGHGASGGRADILIKDNNGKSYLIIECKTAGGEFDKAWNVTQTRPTQLFSYAQQERSTKFIALYASDFIDKQVISNYYLINLFDSDEVCKSKKLKSYQDATTVEEIYQVWRDTYSRDYTSFGIFERNQAYHIGEQKPTLSVLKNINSHDIQGKYHEFATILRQHNVSGRENAFDKLVNLFLCKVVDEKENPDELRFYWNGKAYDDPFDFQDRLQRLYKNGMEKFLGETITYIDNSQIDEAFALFKNKPNSTKDKIKEFLRAQKFFTNSDFAFIEVHNEKLFYQNFDVLLKIARMIQDVSLTGSDENQFLGDMFEGFLDQGVKQSEGQFFTPMPIVKFIINSLPHRNNPQVIDYACGAGHFLNEYATTNQHKEKRIVGIEKEYRLSKVAKVSSFMYGSEIEIIYDDALKTSDKVQDHSFDVLIANPPYSVKGFLETLSDDDRNKFELIKTIDEKSYTTNNAIECFFIERAKQLLAKDGVAGIIVPSSILNKGSKDNIYVATREILLKYFDIVAIAEFGSGTFGKTGTNTVTLFLQRRSDVQDYAGHYLNMVNSWFDGDFISNQEFADNDLLARYCNHIEVNFEIYQNLLQNKLLEELFKHETFAEYKTEFEKSTDTKNRRSKKNYKDLDKTQQEEKETLELIKYIKEIERDKLYYFCLAAKNVRDVIIVKSPSDGKESKKFLGYEWSSAKGNEGIKYLVNNATKLDDEELDEEDKRILENLQGLKSINTPLYNPQDKEDTSKINSIIANNFISSNTEIPESLTQFVSKARLVDMLDFSRVEFNKAISLTPSKKVEIMTKYPLLKLGNLVEVINGLWTGKAEPFIKVTVIRNTNFASDGGIDLTNVAELDVEVKQYEKRKLKFGDIVVEKSGGSETQAVGRVIFFNKHEGDYSFSNFTSRLRVIDGVINPKYLYLFLNYFYELGYTFNLQSGASGIKNLNFDYYLSTRTPVPPMEIQEQIVAECQKVDNEVSNAQLTTKTAKQSIEGIINSTTGNLVKLDEKLLNINQYAINPHDYAEKMFTYVDIDSVGKGNGVISYVNTVKGSDAPSRARRLVKSDSIIISTVRPYLKGFAYIAQEVEDSVFSTGFLVLQSKNENMIMMKYLYSLVMFSNDLMRQMEEAMPKSAYPSINKTDLTNFKIPLPPIGEQKEIVARIEEFEQQIVQAQQVIDNAKAQKQAILNKYLN